MNKLISYGNGDIVRCIANQLTDKDHGHRYTKYLIVGKTYTVDKYRKEDANYPPLLSFREVGDYVPAFLFELVKRDDRIWAGDRVRLKKDALTNIDPLDILRGLASNVTHLERWYEMLKDIDPEKVFDVVYINDGYRYLLRVLPGQVDGDYLSGYYFERVNT